MIVDVAGVWAVGARSDGEVYDEMTSRVQALPQTPQTLALAAQIQAPLITTDQRLARATPHAEAVGP